MPKNKTALLLVLILTLLLDANIAQAQTVNTPKVEALLAADIATANIHGAIFEAQQNILKKAEIAAKAGNKALAQALVGQAESLSYMKEQALARCQSIRLQLHEEFGLTMDWVKLQEAQIKKNNKAELEANLAYKASKKRLEEALEEARKKY